MRKGSITQDHSRAILMAGGLLILSLCLLGILMETQNATLLNAAYPAVAFMIGGWLYMSHPPLYLGFMWWIWFLTPFMRRVADYQAGGHDPINPIMLAPLLVTGLTFFTLLRYGKRLRENMYFPLLLAMMGVGYGYVIGIIRVGPLSATYGLLKWLLPLLIGLHVYLFWKLYPAHRRVIRTTFTWGVLVMGAYGIAQYLLAPAWDMTWLKESGMVSSMGQPRATEFRIFGTLNATGPYAKIIMVGLLLLFDGRGLLPRLAALPGYISFMLTLVRAAWGGWFVGLGFIASRLRGKLRVRLLAILAVVAVLAVPFFLYAPNTERVTDRAESLTDLDDDGSLNARMMLYRSTTPEALLNPVGEGIGSLGGAARLSTGDSVSFDSGVLAIPFTLGWPGTLLYLTGLGLLIADIITIKRSETDQFAVIAAAIVLAFIAMMVFHNQLEGLSGVTVWSFLGLALAAKKYYAHARPAVTTQHE